MKKFIKTTPDGVKDLLFDECINRRAVENRLMDIFRLRGYNEVLTPTLEFYDIFSFDTSYMPMQEMYKLTDLSGRLLVLKPDITVALARVVATHLKDAKPPVKLCYNQNVFRITPRMSGQRDEIAQCGVELIGVNGEKSDLEIITTALAAMRSFCGGSFRFEIGHVSFFNSLINQIPLDNAQRDEVYALMRMKNYALINDLLSEYADSRAARGLMRLPRMFGGAEVLAEAREYAADGTALETIHYLEEIYNFIIKLGFKEQVIIDLGVAPENPYYTGIVFRGWREGLGSPVLSGGRYDKLLKEFGRDLPAMGFAIYVDEAVKASAFDKDAKQERKYVVHSEKGFETDGFAYADKLRQDGFPCSISVFDELDQSKRYAEETGAELIFIGKQNMMEKYR